MSLYSVLEVRVEGNDDGVRKSMESGEDRCSLDQDAAPWPDLAEPPQRENLPRFQGRILIGQSQSHAFEELSLPSTPKM